ncbi:hypothetical protein BGZ80_000242 [Entomortierella chlamydospora]|uniref:Uncharacterized protein n=1 Tax=Entomortierella chlamydospora TaxID=101097 RepID=A0A9P6MSI4_9FUNG|nr:hypothetical protein BGZ80_000242 [Entomortierella chlamydospora]
MNPFAPRQGEPSPVSMALFTAKTNENRSTHDYDYTFWRVGDDEDAFESIPVHISNMIESPQEDYQSFQSNLAFSASRHNASLGIMNAIKSVQTTALVDGHEAMYRDSFEATKSLVKSVLASEQAVKDALKEIEQIKEQVENAKVAASLRKRGRLQKQEQTISQQQQQPHSHPRPHSQIARTSPFNSTAGSPPDLLY